MKGRQNLPTFKGDRVKWIERVDDESSTQPHQRENHEQNVAKPVETTIFRHLGTFQPVIHRVVKHDYVATYEWWKERMDKAWKRCNDILFMYNLDY